MTDPLPASVPARPLESLAPETLAHSTDAPGCQPTLDLPDSPTASPSSPVDGERYEIGDKLGEGGMGSVFKAHDRRLGRTVALKVIRTDAMSSSMRLRFESEARAVAGLDHPHIVKVFDVGQMPMPGEPAPVPFLTLEFVEGGSLAKRLGRDPLPPADAARLVAMLARAMQHAHERGIVHRDLKPDNVLLAPAASVAALNTSLGCPKITDFGLARRMEGNQRLTGDGAVVGTPAYMAPEQAEGQSDIGPAADVWALGVILHQLLSGNLPFQSSSLVELLHKVCREETAPLVGVPSELAAIAGDCLRKRAEERPAAAVLAERLERFLHSSGGAATVPETPAAGPRSRPSRVGIMAVAAGLVAIAILAFALWPKHTETTTPSEPDKPNPPASKLAIRPLQVMLYQTDGAASVARGRIGQQSFAANHGDAVTLTVELSREAYFYVIAFNFDGKEQLLWPVDEQGKPSDETIPPLRQRLRYPTGETRVYLDDDAKSGLQAYVIAASSNPLPSYAEWRAARSGANWKALPAGKTVYEADAQATYAVTPGVGADRGTMKEAEGVPPLARVCRGIRVGGVEAVEGIAFPVLPKENEQ